MGGGGGSRGKSLTVSQLNNSFQYILVTPAFTMRPRCNVVNITYFF